MQMILNSIRQANCILCRIFCGDGFFDCDASREIDRLTVRSEAAESEVKRLQEELRDAKRQ